MIKACALDNTPVFRFDGAQPDIYARQPANRLCARLIHALQKTTLVKLNQEYEKEGRNRNLEFDR